MYSSATLRANIGTNLDSCLLIANFLGFSEGMSDKVIFQVVSASSLNTDRSTLEPGDWEEQIALTERYLPIILSTVIYENVERGTTSIGVE